MDWEAIGAVGEFLGALGVIVTLIYLATQIRQNTGAIHSQTRATIFSGIQEELWKNMEFPDVTLNLKTTSRVLSAEEKIRLDAWLTASLKAREFAWLEYSSGNIDAHQWAAEQQVISIILGTDRTRQWWRNIASSAFHPDFAAVVDSLITDQPETDFVDKVLSIE